MKSKADIERFEKVAVQLESMLNEFDGLSSKKPNDAVNKFKLNLINTILRAVNLLIDASARPFQDFSEFQEDALPSNSDVKLMLAQYRTCMEQFFGKQLARDSARQRVWSIGGKASSVPAPDSYQQLVRPVIIQRF